MTTEKRPGEYVRLTNELVDYIDTDWFVLLSDDDLLDPGHLASLRPHFKDADIVYGWPRIVGLDASYSIPFDEKRLRAGNYIPGCAVAVRTELWRDLGGYHDVVMEDWDFWVRAMDACARFACTEQVSWTLRYETDRGHHSLPGFHG